MSLFTKYGHSQELIGLEVENAVVDPGTGLAVPYSGRNGVRELLEKVATEFGGKPIYDGEHLTGIETERGALITLEHGGAVEYASAPTADLATAVKICGK